MSKRVRQLFLLIILIAGLVYGGSRLFIWYNINQTLENTQKQLSAFASLEYGEIKTPLLGPVGVTEIHIKPNGYSDSIYIASVLLHIEDPIAKVKFYLSVYQNQIADQMRMSFNGIRLSLKSDMVKQFNAAQTTHSFMSTLPGCGQNEPLGLSELSSLGYEEIRGHARFDFDFDRSRGLNVSLSASLDEISRLHIDIITPVQAVAAGINPFRGIPKLSSFSVSLTDLSFHAKLSTYCSKRLNITKSEFDQKVVQDFIDSFQSLDFVPSAELVNAYQRYLSGESTISVGINPFEPMELLEANPVDMKDAIERLGLEVYVDDTQIEQLGKTQGKTSVEGQESDSEKSEPVETFQLTPYEQLGEHIKRRIRLNLVGDLHRKGYLEHVDDQQLIITDHLVGGSVTYEIPRDDIREILVFRP